MRKRKISTLQTLNSYSTCLGRPSSHCSQHKKGRLCRCLDPENALTKTSAYNTVTTASTFAEDRFNRLGISKDGSYEFLGFRAVQCFQRLKFSLSERLLNKSFIEIVWFFFKTQLRNIRNFIWHKLGLLPPRLISYAITTVFVIIKISYSEGASGLQIPSGQSIIGEWQEGDPGTGRANIQLGKEVGEEEVFQRVREIGVGHEGRFVDAHDQIRDQLRKLRRR